MKSARSNRDQQILQAKLDLLQHIESERTRNEILDAVLHQPATPSTLRRLLENSIIPSTLKAELWDLRFPPRPPTQNDSAPPSAPVPSITEAAALHIFRDVHVEYQALSELGPREMSQDVMDFLMDVQIAIKTAIKGHFPLDRFISHVLTAEPSLKYPDPPRSTVILTGRHFAASKLWPVQSYFNHPQNR